MPRTVLCDEGDGVPARYLVSDMETANAVAICEAHWGPWIRTLADALPPGPDEMPAEEATAAAEAAGEGEAAPSTPRPKRRRQGAENGPQALTSETSPLRGATEVER